MLSGLNEKPLKKLLSLTPLFPDRASVISGLTARQGFVFSVFPSARDLGSESCAETAQAEFPGRKRHWNQRVVGRALRDIGCTDCSGGAANGGRASFPWRSFGRLRPGPTRRRWKRTS